MKNVIIGGTVRSGKTTLACKLFNETKISLCESDTIVNAFNEVYPQLGILHKKPKESREIFKPFLFEVLNGFVRSLKYKNVPTVFPGSQFLPEHIAQYGQLDRYVVIFLGMGHTTAQNLLERFREKDGVGDWTADFSNEKLIHICQQIIDESLIIEQQCQQYGFLYYDTFDNREATFNTIVSMIKEFNK